MLAAFPKVPWQVAFSWLQIMGGSGAVGVWEGGRSQGISPPLSAFVWAFLTVVPVPHVQAYCGSNLYLVTLAPRLRDTTFVPAALRGGHSLPPPPAAMSNLYASPSLQLASKISLFRVCNHFESTFSWWVQTTPLLPSASHFACFPTYTIDVRRMEWMCSSDTTREGPLEIQEEL